MDDEDDEGADPLGYDPSAGTYRSRHPTSDGAPISISIVMTVAAVADEEPTAVQPLHEVVDPGALNSLFADESFGGCVSFTLDGFPVEAHADGEIIVDVSAGADGHESGE